MKAIGAKETDAVLEATDGTCVCGKMLTSMVQKVGCLDAVLPMLDVGIKNASKTSIGYMEFIHGLIEETPFPEVSFEIVMTKLSFLHFQEKLFSEMDWVLKLSGKLVVIDIEITKEDFKETKDMIERRRDCSHGLNRSRQEFVSLYENVGYKLDKKEGTRIPVRLSA